MERHRDGDPSAEELSLTAELLLLAIEPQRGGLVARRRRRFRRALALASRAGSGRRRRSAWGAARARRQALGELERAGLIQPQRLLGRLRLADKASAGKRFRRLVRCIEDDDLAGLRDRELVLLLAWSGVLARRLNREERRIAMRRLRKLVRSLELGALQQAPLGGQAPTPEWIDALGRVAYREQVDMLEDGVSDLVSGDAGGLEAVGLGTSDGGGSAGGGGAGGETGGGDGGR